MVINVSLTCECGKHFRVSAQHPGSYRQCPACGRFVLVEQPRDPVRNVVNKHRAQLEPTPKIFFAPDIPARKLEKAVAKYARDANPEEVLVLLDNTAFGSAKNGALLTNRKVYAHNLGDACRSFELGQIEAVSCTDSFWGTTIRINNTEFFTGESDAKGATKALATILTEIEILHLSQQDSETGVGVATLDRAPQEQDRFVRVIPGLMLSWARLPWWWRWSQGGGGILGIPVQVAIEQFVIQPLSSGKKGYMINSGHYACLSEDYLAFLVTDQYKPAMKETVDRTRELASLPLANVRSKYATGFWASLSQVSVDGPTADPREEVLITLSGAHAFHAASSGVYLVGVSSLYQKEMQYKTLFAKHLWRGFLSQLKSLCSDKRG